MSSLGENQYGKEGIRLTKVVRRGSRHELHEYCLGIRLQGAFEPCYRTGNNASVIPTDSLRNTVYALARQMTFESPEDLGAILTNYFLQGYPQVSFVGVDVAMTLWSRLRVDGRDHDNAFAGPGMGVRTAAIHHTRGQPVTTQGGIRDLHLIKTTDSGFAGFRRDRYTTLTETTDRILATNVRAVWTYAPQERSYEATFAVARQAILDTFATHHSLSLQQTLYAVGEEILAKAAGITQVSLSMTNQHRLLANLEPFGLDNPKEIFVATNEPFGMIQGTVVRDGP